MTAAENLARAEEAARRIAERLEVWLPVVVHEGLYEVSSQGRVRNPLTGHILKPDTTPQGYKVVHLGGKRQLMHRLVAQAFLPNPEVYPLVRHLNGDPAQNHVQNLAWGTTAMNIADAQAHGTMPVARHGTTSMYRLGCRCDSCRDAATRYARARRAANPAYAERRRQSARAWRARKKETPA